MNKKSITFAVSNDKDRNVAQLVAHYVRDVGVGRSSRLIPTEKGARFGSLFCYTALTLRVRPKCI